MIRLLSAIIICFAYLGVSFSQSFSVIGLPDTQSYINLGEPDDSAKWMSQVWWIHDNYIDSNIVFVSHFGDVTDGNTIKEWQFADTGFRVIEAIELPYGICPGNHDRTYSDGAFRYENYFDYFGSRRFSGRDYYQASYGKWDEYNLQFFDAAGMEFMVLHLTYSAQPPGIAWADSVLKANPNRRAILTSHNIANYDPGQDTAIFDYSGQLIYDGLKDNPNLFLMLCGHYHDAQRATRRMDSFNGSVIQTQMANYQGLNGHIRILKFVPEKDTVYVTSYSPLYRTFLTDPDNQFAFYYDMDTVPAENDIRIPTLTDAVIETSNPSFLTLTFDQPLIEIAPPLSSFEVKVNSAPTAIELISITGTEVKLLLSSPVVYGDAVTVAYTKPSKNPLQTSAGGQAASFTAQNVTNNVNALLPVYVSSVVDDASPSALTLTFNMSLANIVPATSAFSVMVNLTARTISSVAISGTKVTLTLPSPVEYGDAVTVAYTKPSTNPLQASAGGQAASFSGRSVTNNCTPPENKKPAVSISSPTKSESFTAPAVITIDAIASDPDGSIVKVEFYNDANKLGEKASYPYFFVSIRSGTC